MARGGFRLENVTVRYAEVPALDDVSLDVAPGERVALIGPSGAGKTTLLRLLNGGAVPAHGRVLVDAGDLATLRGDTLRRHRADVGFVHQDLRLVPNLRVSQNVLAGRLGRVGFAGALRLLLRPDGAARERVHALLERVGVGEYMFQRVDRLSGGQAQRVAIARALFQDPLLLLADEPVASVDPARAENLLALLSELGREHGLTVVVSLHNPDLARRHFDRLVGLRAGRVVFDAPGAAVDADRLDDLYRLERDHEL